MILPRRFLLLVLGALAACRTPETAPSPAPDTARAASPAPAGAPVGGEAALARMQGWWQALDDTAARVEVRGDRFVSHYTGEAAHGGTLAFVEACEQQPADPQRRYFVLTEEGTPYCYFLAGLSDTLLQVTYVAQRQTLVYRRLRAGASGALPTSPPALALEGDGLRFVDPASGAARSVAFGAPRAQAETALTAALGAPDETGTNAECGAGPLAYRTWKDGFTVWFAGDALAGWAVDGRTPTARRFTTMAGLGVGTSRAELNDAYEVRVGETSLGTEFDAGGLGGLLSSAAPDATVTHLWAGTTCVAR